MENSLTLSYDEQSDTLYINTVAAYPEQDSDDIEDAVIARMNPNSGAVENLAILFFTRRLKEGLPIHLPVSVAMTCQNDGQPTGINVAPNRQTA